MAEDEQPTNLGLRAAPAEVWDAVRDDYLAGLSGPDCCRRHGVTLPALRARATRHGWRRADQPWRPSHTLEPWDEGLELEDRIGGDMNLIDFGDLPHVAAARMARAILRGDAADALRWHRVHGLVQADDDDLRRWVEIENLRQDRRAAIARQDAIAAAEEAEDAARDSVESATAFLDSRPSDDG